MEEGLPGEEPALAQEARAEKEAGAPVNRPEPPRPRNPRPAAEPRPQQVRRQKRSGWCRRGSNSPRSQPLRFERLWKRQLLPDYSIRQHHSTCQMAFHSFGL